MKIDDLKVPDDALYIRLDFGGGHINSVQKIFFKRNKGYQNS